MPLNIQPFRFDHFYRPDPPRPVMNGQWGPPDQSKQFQDAIASILPQLGEAYKGVRGQLKAEEAEAETRLIGTTPAGKVAELGSTIYGNPPKLQDAGTPGGSGDPGMRRQYDDPTYALLKQEEGYRDKPYWDVNAHRVGYGSDTYTDPATGKVGKVTPDITVTREMADADLQRRVTEFQNGIRTQVPGFDALPAGTKAALTSVAYNYGSLPASVVEAAKAGNNQVLAASVAGLESNPDRRKREAALILSQGTTPVAGGGTGNNPGGGEIFQSGELQVRPAFAPGQTFGRTATANAQPFTAIVQHHTATPDLQTALNVAKGDPSRGGNAFGYHFYVDRDGSVVQGAPLSARTNHVMGNQERGINNSNAIGVSLVGNGDDATPQQIAAATKLTQELQGRYGIGMDRIVGHGEIQSNKQHAEGSPVLTALRSGGGGAPTGAPAGAPAVAAAGTPPGTPGGQVQPMAGTPYDATKPVPPNQQIQPMPGQDPAAVAQAQAQPPQQPTPQPQQAAFQPNPVPTPPPRPQGPPGGPQGQQPPGGAPTPQRVQVASADPGFVPGGPAPGPGIGIDPATGQRQAVDANGNPIAAPPPPPPPGPQTAGGPQQRPPVTPASPQQIAQTAAQIDPHYRNALAAAIGSRDPSVVRGVIEAGERLLGGKDQFDFVNGPDGNMYRVNKRTGVPELAIKGAGKPTELKEINGVTHEWDGQKWTPRGGGVQKAPEMKDINGTTHQWDGSKWVAMPSGGPEWRNATPEERKEAGVEPTGGPMQVNTKTGEIKFPSKAGGVNVSVGAGETEEAKELGKERAKQQSELSKQAQGSLTTIGQVGRMRQLLTLTQQSKLSPGINTLALYGRAMGISDETLTGLGFDPKAAVSYEAAQALTGAFLSNMLTTGQFPSANLSNSDRAFIEGQLPSVGKSKEANDIIMAAMEQGAKRSIEKQKMWYAAKKSGTTWDDFQQQWIEYVESQPNLFQTPDSKGEVWVRDPNTGRLVRSK